VRWRRSPRALWRIAPGYLVVGAADGSIVEVVGPGCDLWAHLEGWIEESALSVALAREYGAEEPIVSGDVRSLLEELHAQGYVDRDG
jgi:hypothetical protein